MGSHRQLFVFLFTAFLLFFSLLAFFVTHGVADEAQDANCANYRNSNCRQRKHENSIPIFKNDNLEVTMDVHDWNAFPDTIGEDSPKEEEWSELIKALSENKVSEYVKKNSLIFTQKQKGSYNYSYGNDGRYWSTSHARMSRFDTKGRASSLYFQIAIGETGKPAVNYTSGFAIFSDIFFSFTKDSARWQGKEKGAFFNKNPDGSYTIFGFSSAGIMGEMKATPEFVKVDSSAYMVLNASHFVTQSVLNNTYTMKFNGDEADVTGGLTMSTKVSPKSNDGFPQQLMILKDKYMEVKGKYAGVYPKSGKGDFHNTFSATISGSIVNSTLTTKTKGHEWFDHDMTLKYMPNILHSTYLV